MSGPVPFAAVASGTTATLVAVGLRRRQRQIRRRVRRVGLASGTTGAVAGGAVGSLRSRLCEREMAARHRERSMPLLASVVVGLGAALLVGGVAGWMLGVVLAAAGLRWLPAPPNPAQLRRRREAIALRGQLPLAADLLAGCLSSWCPPDAATAAVAKAIPQPMAGRLAAAATELSMGADPEVCWERLGTVEPVLAPLGRCLARAAASGAPPAAGLARLADAERAAAAREAQARVRRAGVLATAPLGLCFLPAFVLVGVVPVVTGLAGSFLTRV